MSGVQRSGRRLRAVAAAVLVCLAALLLAGCSSSGDEPPTASAAPTTTPAGAPSSTPSPASTPAPASGTKEAAAPAGSATTSEQPARGCPATTTRAPAGALTRATGDVDGDGLPDSEWLDPSGSAFGITTASGATFSARIDLAGGGPRSLLVADVTGRGEWVAFTSDGRTADLWAISACSFVPERNAQSQPYQFDLGFRGNGNGVGCVDVDGDGVRELVGLRVVTDAAGATTAIERTVIDLRGPDARNGAVDQVTRPSATAVELARQVTCGDRTVAADGLTTGG